jgi:hypothetical protein
MHDAGYFLKFDTCSAGQDMHRFYKTQICIIMFTEAHLCTESFESSSHPHTLFVCLSVCLYIYVLSHLQRTQIAQSI